MKTLNNIIYCALAALLSLAATSCVEETYTPGEPELEGCYGVYFPTGQENAGTNNLDPDAAKSLTFTASRLNKEGTIEVPVVVEASEDGIFEISKISFEDGQETTEFTVTFDNAQLGTPYSCRLTIEDPQYAQVYGQNAFTLDFSVSIIKWNKVTGENGEQTGKWRDDILTGPFNASAFKAMYLETDVEIYEQDGNDGYYRIDNIYTQDYVESMYIEQLTSACTYTKVSIFIDATDPEKVWIPEQNIGVNVGPYGGEMYVVSDVAETMEKNPANLYGTLKNGVIEFPAQGLLTGVSAGLYYGNTSGKTRLILPGYKAFDYSIAVSPGTGTDGVLPVTFSVGTDIKKVEYAVFEGRYDDGQIYSAATNIAGGKVEGVKELDLTTPSVELSGMETGFYTVVAVAYDEAGTNQNYAATSFGYVAAGEEKPVNISAGLIVSDKYAPEGNTSENSMEYYIYGEEVEAAYMNLYKTSALAGASGNQIAYDLLMNGTELSSRQLNLLNNSGLSGIFEGLNAGTEYTLVIYATNGYEETLYTAEAATEGVANPLYNDYSGADLSKKLTKEQLLGTWNFYAIAGEETQRVPVGPVTIKEAEDVTTESGMTYDMVTLSGMFAGAGEQLGFNDDIEFQYYDGFIFTYSKDFGTFTMQGQEFSAEVSFGMSDGKYYSLPMLFVGGLVEDMDVIPFVNSGAYENQGLTATAVSMALDVYQGDSYVTTLLELSDMLLAAPDKYPLPDEEQEETAASLKASGKAHNVAREFASGKMNYVETTEGRIMSIIDRIQNTSSASYSSKEVPMRRDIRSVAFEAAPASNVAVSAADGSIVSAAKRF